MIVPLEAAQLADIRPLLARAEELGDAVFAEFRRGSYPDVGDAFIDVGIISKGAAAKIRKVLDTDAPNPNRQ